MQGLYSETGLCKNKIGLSSVYISIAMWDS